MIVTLRYMEMEGSAFNVRAAETLEQHKCLRQFPAQEEVTTLAARAIHEPGEWVTVASGGECGTCA